MPRSLWAIITNTFTETLRQSVYGVVVISAVILLIFGPSLAMYTLDDDNQLLKDIELSTLLVTGLFLAVFASATVVSDEIENKTVLTVITKTVSRTGFVVGKFLGIAGAVLLAQYFLALVLMIVVRHGVLQRASDLRDMVAITLGGGGLCLVLLAGAACNYVYHWRFSSTTIILGSVVATVVLAVLVFVDPEWNFNPAKNNIHTDLAGPIILIFIATLILVAVAVAAATRLNLIMTFLLCVILFVLGAAVHFWLGPISAQPNVIGYLARAVLALVPAINIFVVSNAIYTDTPIPLIYIGQTAAYALCYVTAALLFAIALFRSREIS